MHKHLMVGVFVPLGGLDGIVKDQHAAEQPAGGDLDALKRGPSIVQNCVYLHGLGHPRPDEIDDPLHADTPSLRNHGTRYQGTKQTNQQFSIWPGSLVPWFRTSGSSGPKHHGRDRTADPLHHVFLHGHADLIRRQVAHGQRFLHHFADDRLCVLPSPGVFILHDHPVIPMGESQPDCGSDPLAWGVAGDARVHRRRQRPRHELGYGDDRDADREDAGHPKEVQIGDTRVHERSIERRQPGTPPAAAGYDRDGFGLFPHAGPPRKPTVFVPYQRGWYAYLSAPFICRVSTGRGRIPIPSTDDCSCPSRILGTWAYYDIRPGGTLKLVSSRRDRTA